jgi:uncharacterized protein (TIGR03067 family)
LLIAADKPTKEARSDQDRLQGAWSVVSLTDDGNRAPEALVKKLRVVFKEGRIIIKPWVEPLTDALARSPDRDEVHYLLDPSGKPKSIGFTSEWSAGKGIIRISRIPGIYALDGDRLRICWRFFDKPTQLSSTADNMQTLLVLSRQKK